MRNLEAKGMCMTGMAGYGYEVGVWGNGDEVVINIYSMVSLLAPLHCWAAGDSPEWR